MIEEINIRDLLDSNGNPFTVQQAYSFSEECWRYAMMLPIKDMVKCVDENVEFSDEHWLTVLQPLNTIHRVRSILRVMRLKHIIPEIEVTRKDGKLYLIDGRHRCWASILFGQDKIKAEITDR